MFDRLGIVNFADRYGGQELLFDGLSLESLMTEGLPVIEPVKLQSAAECRPGEPAKQCCTGGCR